MQFAILFSPSEDKVISHDCLPEATHKNLSTAFLESLWGNNELICHREQILKYYYEALNTLLQNRDKTLLENIYGAKNFNDKNLFELHYAMKFEPLMPAIERYSGIAFKELEYSALSQQAKNFILQKVFIFSNLFGVIQAKDSIPFYKLKQGTKLQNLTLKSIYKPFIPILHKSLKSIEYIIDLRAGIYTKLFMPNLPHFFFDFQKDGKAISHYSKLYRGKILKLLAKNQCNLSKNECFEYLCNIDDTTLKFNTYKQQNNCIHLSYEILSSL